MLTRREARVTIAGVPGTLRVALGLAAVAGLLAAAPVVSAQTDGLPEDIVVGPNATSAPSKAVLKEAADYDVQVSGTMNVFSANDGRGGHTQFHDAFYCFGSQPAGWCATPEGAHGLGVRTSGDAPGDGGDLSAYANPRWYEPPFQSGHVYDFVLTPYKDGSLIASTRSVCSASGWSCSGSGFKLHISDHCRSGTQGRAAAINEVRVVAVTSSVAIHRAGSPDDQWCEAEKDHVLKQGDEISCDPDGSITLAFADNSTVTVRHTTQLKIASFFTSGGVVRTEILLKMGEVAAKVNKSEATKSDFVIKGPTFTASVRGTTFSAFYDPGSKSGLVSTTEGRVRVDPVKAGLKTVDVSAGKQVEIGASSISRLAKIGQAGARGGVNRQGALNRVLKVIARGNTPCGAATARSNATAVTPAPLGWVVAVKLVGKVKGTSRWTVEREKVKPANALASRLAGSCR